MSTLRFNNKRIAKNTVYLYIRLLFTLLISLYTVRIVLNALGQCDYGIYNVVGGFIAMFGFLNSSLSTATQRFYNFEVGQNGIQAANKVFNISLKIQLFIALIIFIFAELIGLWYINTHMVIPEERIIVANWVYQFSIFSLLLTVVQIPFVAAAMAFEKMDFYAIVGVLDACLKLIIAFIISSFGYDKLWLYGLLMFGVSIINFILYVLYSKLKIKNLYLTKITDKNYSKGMLVFSSWNMIGSFAYMIKTQGINILLNYFYGATINAATGIVGQISGALQMFTANIVIAFKPQLTQSYAQGDKERTKLLWFTMSKVSFVLTLTFAVPLILEMNYILCLWLGDNVPNYTVDFACLIVLSFLIAAFHAPMVQVIQAVGKLKIFQIVTSVIICLIMPISWACLMTGMEPTSVFIVICIIYVLNHFCAMRLVHEVFPYSYCEYIKDILIPCMNVGVLLPIVPCLIRILLVTSLFRLIVVIMFSIIISGILSYLILMNDRQRTFVLDIVKSKIKRTC